MPRRNWSPARQLALEKPPDPIVSGCEACGPKRTRIMGPANLQVCLKCHGCPWCGQRHITEEMVDPALVDDPIRFGTRLVRGDFMCTACSRTLVDWSGWRRRMRNWLRGARAKHEGYRTRRKAA